MPRAPDVVNVNQVRILYISHQGRRRFCIAMDDIINDHHEVRWDHGIAGSCVWNGGGGGRGDG